MNSILDKIAHHKRLEVDILKREKPLNTFSTTFPTTRDFISALKQRTPAIIAEIKKASPSKGIIRADFDVAAIAEIYEHNGASCLSVLTDQHFFQGDSSYLGIAKQHSRLPVLRKDFIIDSYQIHESRLLGADCILLIVAMLDDQQLHDFCQEAQALDMAVLVESHTAEELERALLLPTPLMGINNRSLHNFITNIHTSIELSKNIPADKLIITESGMNTRADILLMLDNHIHTFLIGESLMRAENIGIQLRVLLGD